MSDKEYCFDKAIELLEYANTLLLNNCKLNDMPGVTELRKTAEVWIQFGLTCDMES